MVISIRGIPNYHYLDKNMIKLDKEHQSYHIYIYIQDCNRLKMVNMKIHLFTRYPVSFLPCNFPTHHVNIE